MKVICAGLQKTGTKSMAEALRILGYNVHDVFEQYAHDRELWEKITEVVAPHVAREIESHAEFITIYNDPIALMLIGMTRRVRNDTATVEDYQRILDDVDAVTDIPACGLWEEIFDAFPNAKVILMIRSSEDEWCASVKRHCRYMYQYTPLKRFGLPTSVYNFFIGPKYTDYAKYQDAFMTGCTGFRVLQKKPSMEVVLRIKYRQHNCYVQTRCPKDQLLVFNVKSGWGPLCKFLKVPTPDVPFPVVNVDGEVVQKVIAGKYADMGLIATVKRQAAVRISLCVFVLLAALLYFMQIYLF